MVDIAYLVPGTGLPTEEQQRRERIANKLTTGSVSVVQAGTEGPTSIESAVEEAWSVVGEMQKAYEIRDQVDAIVIGCFGDPGLRPLREILDIPVVGPAESSFYTAAQIADRIGLLTILESTEPTAREQMDEYGLSDRVATVRSTNTPVGSIDHESNELVEGMVEVGEKAVEEDGAEVLIPGCMSLSFAQRHKEIENRIGVPFLDPATISLEQAAVWARHGITQSPKTYPEAPFEKLDGLLENPEATVED